MMKRRLVIAITAGVVLVCSAAEVATLPSSTLALADEALATPNDLVNMTVVHPSQDAWTAMFQAAAR